MRVLKAFVARSFQEVDDEKVKPILDILDSFKPLGLVWETAERAEIESVSKKVQRMIEECDVFVAIFTRRHPIFADLAVDGPPTAEPFMWTGPPWLFQESGYALRANKKLMLFRESDVEFPNLQGDLEYIPYDPQHPQGAWIKAHEMLVGVISKNAGITTEHLISAAEPTESGEVLAKNDPVVIPSSDTSSPLNECLSNLFAAQKEDNLEKIKGLEDKGAEIILSGAGEGVSEITWRCLCRTVRGNAGDPSALQDLQDLAVSNPEDPGPLRALAQLARNFGEAKKAGDWYVRAADVGKSDPALRIHSAQSYRAANRWDLARLQLDLVLGAAEVLDSVRADAFKEMFWGLKEEGDTVGAFCFGEAALLLQPNDSDFRFHLAYAYGDTTGGYQEHDYRDLALHHYKVLVKRDANADVARNNLGVAYNGFDAPISATDQFKAASERGNPLATANVMRQYLRGGLVDDAKKWAEDHTPISDEEGHIAQALASIHSDRNDEEAKVSQVLKHEAAHRSALANLAEGALSVASEQIAGNFVFPEATLRIDQKGDFLNGKGESTLLIGEKKHHFHATRKNNVWRFTIESRSENDSAWSNSTSSYGLMAFSGDGERASVLEYQSDGVIATYEVTRTRQ